MRTWVIAGALALGMALSGCGIAPHNHVKTPTEDGHRVVMMSSSIFEGARTVTLRAGQTLRFREPTTGGMHVLLAGTRGAAQPQAGAPDGLNDPNGVSVYAGQARDLTFSQPGVYHITTLYHDAMQITVVVK